MSDGENSNVARHVEVDHVIRETGHGAPSDGQVSRNSGHGLACGGESNDLMDGGVNGVEELEAKASSTASYQRPASRYSASASSSNRTREFTVCAIQLLRAPELGPTECPAIHRSRHGVLAVQSRRPRRLRLRQDSRRPRHRGSPRAQRRHRRVRQLAGLVPLAEALALETSWDDFTP